MVVELKAVPKNATIVIGFPGFGLVGTITTEFLMDHLKTELIGKIWMPELPALAAIHEGKVVRPISIHYAKKQNIMIIHGVTATQKLEWNIADAILEVAQKNSSRQIICIEGIGSTTASKNPALYFYSSNSNNTKELEKAKIKPLREGIIVGVTGALMLRAVKTPVSAIFAETVSQMPDSRSSASVISALDSLLGLKVDPKPLMKQAEQFEKKLQGMMGAAQKTQEDAEERAKNLSYMG